MIGINKLLSCLYAGQDKLSTESESLMFSLVKPHCMENFYVKETFASNTTAHVKTVLYLCNYFSGDSFYFK